MDLKQLKAFATLAEFGSFSRAGAVLSVAQPVLSRQIKALEQELGIELFYRNGRGIVLTEAGKLLHGYAGGVLDTVTRAASEVMALRSSPRGTIAIGMPPSVGSVLTVPLVQCFRAEFPLISMRVVEGFSGHLLEWLITGKMPMILPSRPHGLRLVVDAWSGPAIGRSARAMAATTGSRAEPSAVASPLSSERRVACCTVAGKSSQRAVALNRPNAELTDC